MARPYADTIGDTAEKAGVASGYAEKAIDDVKATAADAADRLGSLARDAMDNPEKFARDSYNSVAQYTRDKPLEALAITAGLAFVIGALWKR
ncbi:MAG TPA: hypothetical protein VEA77_05505 [Hyphomicrobium sp.]|nr:hypothetical protein [Hyphomicrobium sp.]